jgi:polyisoprenoid-binding protein YceI
MTMAPEGQSPTRTVWKLDPAHTDVQFSSRHMMVTTVRGRFTHVDGTIVLDEVNPTQSSVEVDIVAASLDSHQEQRDAHLKSADFLDVEHYPTITFRSTRIEPTNASHARVVGELTIRGVTREVVLDTEFFGRQKHVMGHQITGFSATTTINRKDWGLTWNMPIETGGWLVGDTIKVEIDVEAVLQQ